MSIPVTLVTVSMPRNPEDRSTVRLQTHTSGVYGFDEMAEDVAHSTTLTEADSIGAVTAIMAHMRAALLRGKSVELEGIGKFHIVLKSHTVPRTEAQRRGFRVAQLLRGFRVQFIPTTRLKAYLAKGLEIELIKP